jgi:methylthioribose-1-phosphate isomerase
VIRTVQWTGDAVRLIDQRKLPATEVYLDCATPEETAAAIRDMVVRGAPAIGVAAAFGAALGAIRAPKVSREAFMTAWEKDLDLLAASRPTAVNLFWAIDRMRRTATGCDGSVDERVARLVDEAVAIREDDLAINKRMGENGAALLAEGDVVLTHCNAGALATAGDYGTALGVVKAAHLAGKNIAAVADETRPWLQGARLTMWELMKEGIPARLICDNMSGALMAKGKIDRIVVGSDRIAANGDVANKIGTYMVAVLAHRHGVPFYVAAPMSTIDFDCPDGSRIPIEERSAAEVTDVMGEYRIAPEGAEVYNPAFDVTPAELVTAIITENGVAYPPYPASLAALRRD